MRHTTRTNLLLSAILGLSAITALSLGFAGVAWLQVGYGLNPLVAWPLATLVMALPVLIAERCIR